MPRKKPKLTQPLQAETTSAFAEPSFEESRPAEEAASFLIVGIGASAGGLEAVTQMLRALPVDTGMAFVLVQHLDPTHTSMLTEILSRATTMLVSEVEDQMAVEPNRVYVIPPGTNMTISAGLLQLLPRRDTRGHHRSIDYFFRSLAEEQAHNAIGVILSGTASDGTLGLQAIKAEGESPLLRMTRPSRTACPAAPLPLAAWILFSRLTRSPKRLRVSADILTWHPW